MLAVCGKLKTDSTETEFFELYFFNNVFLVTTLFLVIDYRIFSKKHEKYFI
jgi:hypothetical protein